MNDGMELRREREYAAYVQQLLLAVVQQYKGYSDYHDDNIRLMLADAWEELRMKPTALSPQDLEQLSTEINRVLARRAFTSDLVERYERMLMTPFFGRIDFQETGEAHPDKIVVGLYSLKNEKGELMVHDWRAPVCSLYYDAMPGSAAYESPSGTITGQLTLKRQYRMENGRLKYFVDTDVNIEDEMLLDILSRATSSHMRSIVSTIQKEQNAAIRQDKASILSVVGGAGSGKTSVAMHRAAYLMYRHRSVLDTRHIAVLSPGSAFTEYIATVLPDLGEENAQAVTMRGICAAIIGQDVESPAKQNERLIATGVEDLRRQSLHLKSDAQFSKRLERFADEFKNRGPVFSTISLGKHVLCTQSELERLYRVEFRLLNPALRLIRIQTVLTGRLSAWERTLGKQYETRLFKSYRGRDLEMATRLAVSQQLQPIRAQIRAMLEVDPLGLYADALEDAPEALAQAARENAKARLIWWEDAPGVAFLMLRLGFAQSEKHMLQLLIDEAQDYSDIALRMLRLYYSAAQVTLLGDPNQRTIPGMPPCEPDEWGACFGVPDAPVLRLTKCYRSTLPITRLCNALLPMGGKHQIIGRDGDWPMIAPYDFESLQKTLEDWRNRDVMRLIAVITRSQSEAAALSKRIPGCYLLTGEPEDMLPEGRGVVVGGYHLMKGLEFDAVAVVWPTAELTDGESRRLYTACSRALHGLCLFTQPDMIRALGIVL